MVGLAFALKALLLIDTTSLWSDELHSVGKRFQPDFGALLAKKPLPLRMRYFGRGAGAWPYRVLTITCPMTVASHTEVCSTPAV